VYKYKLPNANFVLLDSNREKKKESDFFFNREILKYAFMQKR